MKVRRASSRESQAPKVEARLWPRPDKRLGSSLARIAGVLALLFTVFAIGHRFAVPPPHRETMIVVASATAVLFAALALALRRWPVRARCANVVTAFMGALLLFNSGLHLALVGDPVQTSNLALLIIAAGIFLSSRAWFAACVGATWATWIAIALEHRDQPHWVHFGYELLISTVLAALVFELRRRADARQDRMVFRIEDDRDALRAARTTLERSVDERTTELRETNERLRAENAERRSAEAALEKAKEAAEAADRAKTEFLVIASHELRTPLTSLRLAIQQRLRRRDEHLEAPLLDREVLRRLERQVARLARMVDDLLDASHLQSHQLLLRRSHFDLRELLDERMGRFREATPKHPSTLDLPSAEARIDADPVRVGQVFMNLLDNASRYSPEGTPITARLELARGQARVTVHDQGPGITHEERERIFAPLYRRYATAQLRSPGLGLGLYISRAIIEQHGGELDVLSGEDGGSSFWFSLPLAAEASRAQSSFQQPNDGASA